MRILYSNDLVGSTITSSSEEYLYEDDNIILTNSLATWRSDSTTDSVVFETSGIQPDTIGIKNHNFTSGATIKIEGNATDSWGSPSFTKTLTYREDVIVEEIAPVASYAFWRIYVADGSNPDGYIEIGTVYIGNALEMPGMTPSQSITWNTLSEVEFSQSNQPYGDSKVDFDTFEVETPAISNAERKLIRTMHRTVKNITPVFIQIWEDDMDFEGPAYCVIVGVERGSQKDDVNNWSMALEFREVQ